jgi:hypothetical protein
VSLNRDFSKSINYKIISKLSEKFTSNSEIIGVNFIKIGPAMTSGYLFEKMWFYMKYIVNGFLIYPVFQYIMKQKQ